MKIEYEATFPNINKNQIKERLKQAGAKLISPEFLQKRVVFDFPVGHEIKGGWLRVRDEGTKITTSLKVVDGNRIENQKEICLVVDDFETAVKFLDNLGCRQKSYQETKREIWHLAETEITIDEWPFLEPLVEIEGNSEETVKMAAGQLGFDWSNALFCSTDTIYSMRYGLPEEFFNKHSPRIVFDMDNPFLRK